MRHSRSNSECQFTAMLKLAIYRLKPSKAITDCACIKRPLVIQHVITMWCTKPNTRLLLWCKLPVPECQCSVLNKADDCKCTSIK